MSFPELARRCARLIRGCATDDQYVSVLREIEDALEFVEREERERCSNIALAIDSGRGNEKIIAEAIQSGIPTASLPRASISAGNKDSQREGGK